MPRLPALLTALVLPLPLWAADCPTAADLTTGGIAFDIDQEDTEIFRQKRPGLIESHYHYAGDTNSAARVLLARGLYVLELVDVNDGAPDPGTRSTYSFPVAPDQLRLPDLSDASGQGWSYTVAVNNIGEFGQEVQHYTPQPAIQKSYGDCTYDVIPVEIRYVDDPAGDRDIVYYLPALGLSYLARTIYSDSDDSFDYHSIRTLN